MRLFLEATSERGKPITKSGNDNIIVSLTVDRKPISEIELYLNKDIKNHGSKMDEWTLSFRRSPEEDPNIITQGYTK